MKKLFIALGLFASIGLTSAITLNRGFVQVRAEDESSEIISEEENSESIIESYEDSQEQEETETEEDGFFDKLSQTAKDFLIVAKEILNQPIVIGGVSTTLGVIIVWVVSKLISALSKKKINELGLKVDDISLKLLDSVRKQDYNELAKQTKQLVEVCKVLVDGSRNVKVKEKANLLLLDFKPVVEDNKKFVVEETKKVVEDTKQQVDKTAKDIVGIVNQD